MPDAEKSLDILIRFIADTHGAEAAKAALEQVREAALKASGEKVPINRPHRPDRHHRRPVEDGGETTPNPDGPKFETPGGNGGNAAPRAGVENPVDAGPGVPDGLFKTDSKVADILKAAVEAKASSDRELVAALQDILSTGQELLRAIEELRNFNTNGR